MSSSETPQTGHRALTVIPDRAGVGFKTQHAEAILNTQPELGWLEVHPENYMVPGGPRHVLLCETTTPYRCMAWLYRWAGRNGSTGSILSLCAC